MDSSKQTKEGNLELPKWFNILPNSDQKADQLSIYKKITLSLSKALEETSLLLVINNKGHILFVSTAFCELLQYREEDLIGADYFLLQHRSFRTESKGDFKNALTRNSTITLEMIPKRKNGNPVILQTTMMPLIEGKGDLFLLVHQDVTRLKQAEKVIKELVAVDTLTGLPNRDKFERDISFLIEKGRDGNGSSFAILFIDLDRFKFYNDTLGHFTGDKLIQVIAQTLLSLDCKGLQVYRYGGDEFSLLLQFPESEQEIQTIAEELLQRFQSPFHVKGKELYITASIGISVYPELGTNYDELVHQAEMAMQYAKERGKDDFQWYHPSIRTEHDEKLFMEKRLRLATEKKRFTLVYQPQINLRTKKVVGVEALIRWNDNELGPIAPSVFIALAEETGLVIPIGDWVLEEACKQAKAWCNEGDALRMGINISPLQFQRPDFVSKVKHILRKTQLDPTLLDLEITENDLLYSRKESFKTLERLKELGITISIDDFGTGYSSLSYLRKFPIDTLKIDQSFIQELVENSNDQAIVTSIIQLAHNMNLKVIAEGVETKDMVDFLNERQCDEMQGFLYSKPLPGNEVTMFINQVNPEDALE
ncbi:diguanylate cyclase (GGDEF)-like protein/PAS domain S-box-containing protein [Evansella vedderi]|uniref:Diguanylate cyclase (GGDEF)-like protein/PAS domain S-box-containing protein n=1 Tax=Evansella vedderi TaxID=38282 RepID=A0ABT9ZZ86_9BACI|nr:EAL domain-containing protein [Evansella vedderi]MDQ0256547.1 diguanylate cyclase (GGDEF)-like protein/PAS domain S-box-containing protein [Evansella vedderi]